MKRLLSRISTCLKSGFIMTTVRFIFVKKKKKKSLKSDKEFFWENLLTSITKTKKKGS